MLNEASAAMVSLALSFNEKRATPQPSVQER